MTSLDNFWSLSFWLCQDAIVSTKLSRLAALTLKFRVDVAAMRTRFPTFGGGCSLVSYVSSLKKGKRNVTIITGIASSKRNNQMESENS